MVLNKGRQRTSNCTCRVGIAASCDASDRQTCGGADADVQLTSWVCKVLVPLSVAEAHQSSLVS